MNREQIDESTSPPPSPPVFVEDEAVKETASSKYYIKKLQVVKESGDTNLSACAAYASADARPAAAALAAYDLASTSYAVSPAAAARVRDRRMAYASTPTTHAVEPTARAMRAVAREAARAAARQAAAGAARVAARRATYASAPTTHAVEDPALTWEQRKMSLKRQLWVDEAREEDEAEQQ